MIRKLYYMYIYYIVLDSDELNSLIYTIEDLAQFVNLIVKWILLYHFPSSICARKMRQKLTINLSKSVEDFF